MGNKRYSDLILCPDFNLDWSYSNFKLLGIEFSLDLYTMPDLNFRKKIIDISKVLKSWQHRKQTHITWKGYCDQNTSSSKTDTLIYVITKLETIYAIELNKHFFNFIWDGKTEKIKHNTLIGDIEEGGLKMIHLQSFITYLKVSWVKRFF